MIFSEQNTDLFDVGEVELERPITLPIHAPLKEAVGLIAGQEKGTPSSCILVEEQGLIVGILTERDLVRLSLSATTLQQTTVGEVMTHPVVTLDQESFTDIFSVYSLMRRHRIRHLPILNRQIALGIVTITSLRQSLHLGYFLRFREVREIMTHDVVTATSTMSVLDVAQLMAKNHISCVVIVENNAGIVKPLGILTERDIVQFQSMELELKTLTTGQVMSQPLIHMHPEDSLAIAQKVMQQYRVRRVVVVDQSGSLKGIVTETNLALILDPLELFGMMEILQHRVNQLVADRDRLLPKENLQLQNALEANEFELHYQPQLNIATGQIIGVEALVRWQSPQRGLISPDEFIPIAEMTGFIVPLGDWILREACEQLIAWQQQGLPPLEVSVNVSSLQLARSQFVPRLKQVLAELNFDPRWLKLELTESSLVENIEHTLSQFQAIKKMGVAIAIDDFGTGYASLGYLQHFPFDSLKIDRCFVSNIHDNPKNAAITTAIIRMAQQLDFSVVAEGVEQEAEVQFLRQRHCHIIQGYWVSRPLPPAECLKFMKRYMHPFSTL